MRKLCVHRILVPPDFSSVLFCLKADLEQELKDETDRNQDDITHLELLEKHFEERSKAYEV